MPKENTMQICYVLSAAVADRVLKVASASLVVLALFFLIGSEALAQNTSTYVSPAVSPYKFKTDLRTR